MTFKYDAKVGDVIFDDDIKMYADQVGLIVLYGLPAGDDRMLGTLALCVGQTQGHWKIINKETRRKSPPQGYLVISTNGCLPDEFMPLNIGPIS